MEEEIISLSDILSAIKKRWLLILAITLTTTIVAGVISYFVITPVYQTNTKLFVGKEAGGNEEYSYNDITFYQKLLATYSETIKTKDLINRAIEKEKLDITVGQVLGNLSVNTVTDTQIITIGYSDTDPERAAEVLEALTNEFIKTSSKLVSNGNIQVIDSVYVPQYPSSPNKKMNIAIGFLLGLMVSLGIVFLLEYLDNTYKNKDQIEKELDLPVLGIIPIIDEK